MPSLTRLPIESSRYSSSLMRLVDASFLPSSMTWRRPWPRTCELSEEIRTAGLEQRLNARIMFAVPWSLLVLLTARPGFYRTFYQSRPGITIVLAAAVLSGIALIVVGRLGIEPLEQRVLAVPEGETA